MKADRLVALLLLLQRQERITATEAAAELEVSERTARRDLEALAMAGLPIYAERGRRGGWRLLGGARTDLSGLTAAEARALFLVAGPATEASPQLKAALRKLLRAIPEPFRDPAQVAAASVVHDPTAWGRAGGFWRPPHLDALQEAVADRQQVRLGYRDRAGKATTRVVHPLGTATKGTVWYLLADTDGGLRTFRVGRVTAVEPTGDRVHLPSGFNLDTAWRAVVDRVDELRTPVEVVAQVDQGIVGVLSWLFPRRIVVSEAEPGDRVHVRLRGESVAVMAAQLAGFGMAVEVVEPVAARERLADIARELTETYG